MSTPMKDVMNDVANDVMIEAHGLTKSYGKPGSGVRVLGGRDPAGCRGPVGGALQGADTVTPRSQRS